MSREDPRLTHAFYHSRGLVRFVPTTSNGVPVTDFSRCFHPDSQISHVVPKTKTVVSASPSTTLKAGGECKVLARVWATTRDTLWLLFPAVCKAWCAKSKKPWKNKCKRLGMCDGCSKCLGEWLAVVRCRHPCGSKDSLANIYRRYFEIEQGHKN